MKTKDVQMTHHALVTGAAQGLGLATVYGLLNKGYVVDTIDILPIPAKHSQLRHEYTWDLCSSETFQRLNNLLLQQSYNVIVHSAGVGKIGRFHDIALEAESDMFSINITATHYLVKSFVQSLNKDQKSILILVSSMSGLTPTPGMSAYSASKKFVSGLAESVDLELRLSGYKARII